MVFGVYMMGASMYRTNNDFKRHMLDRPRPWRPPPDLNWSDIRAIIEEADPVTRLTLERSFPQIPPMGGLPRHDDHLAKVDEALERLKAIKFR